MSSNMAERNNKHVHHYNISGATLWKTPRAQGLRESRGGLPGLPVPNIPYGLYGRKATLKETPRP